MNIVLATTTFYKTLGDLRAALAIKMVEAATKCGYPVSVVDDSPEEIRRAIQTAGALVSPQRQKGMGASRRQTIEVARDLAKPDGIIVWLEPEKHTFVPLIAEVCQPFENDPALDLIIPRRRSLGSYPPMQQLAEELGREGFRLATGRALDSWFGPQAFRARVAHYYLNYDGQTDLWDSTQLPPARIVRAGHKVAEVVVDYTHPSEQLEEATFTFYQHRIRQLATLTQALTNNL